MGPVHETLEIFPLKIAESQAMLSFLGIPSRGATSRVLFNYLERKGVKLLLVTEGPAGRSDRNLNLVIGDEELEMCQPDLDTLRVAVEANSVEITRPVAVVRILGPHFDIRPGIAGSLHSRLQLSGIEVLVSAVTITTSHLVVPQGQVEQLGRILGSLFRIPDRERR
jgi:aspartokinase